MDGDGWFRVWRPRAQARHRLLCFSYAGGSAAAFRQWTTALDESVEVCCVEYPGHGGRLAEQPLRRLTDISDALARVIWTDDSRPCVFWGHSMGALVAYELARRLRDRRLPGPTRLVVSGRRAPQLSPSRNPIHTLPDPAFIEELRRLQGTPTEVLQHAELMRMLLPTLRADFEACETYRHEPGEPLACPITALGGRDDTHDPPDALVAWRDQTYGDFVLRLFPGGHFFLHSAWQDVSTLLLAQFEGSIPLELAGPENRRQRAW